jgi:hypothetical protein
VVSLTQEGVVQANASAAYSAQCPSAEPHPVGPEFLNAKGGVYGSLALAASYPQGRRGWVVGIENRSEQPQVYFVDVVCLGAKAKFAYPRSTFVVQPHGYEENAGECPRSVPHAINGYFGPQASSDLGKALLAFTTPLFTAPLRFKHELDGAGVKNLGGVPVGLFAGAVCTSLRTASPNLEAAVVDPGTDAGFTQSCPSRTPIAVSGAFTAKAQSDYGTIVMDASFRLTHRKWFVGVKNLTSRPVPYYAGAVCVG